VTDLNGRILLLQRRDTRRENLPVPVERLCYAVRQLQELRAQVARTARDQRGSAKEWGVACTPLMLRMPAARQSLVSLAAIRVGTWPDTRWAMQLRTAHDEVDWRLADVNVAASSLARKETCTADAAVSFSFDGGKLVKALDDLCELITGRYPVTATTAERN
jgi:hypothetical protein